MKGLRKDFTMKTRKEAKKRMGKGVNKGGMESGG
jgi:hypothetical protein